MEKEFIPYEQALVLKELGFDEPCFGIYQKNKKLNIGKVGSPAEFPKNPTCWNCSAPTFSQAFRWFREKYGLVGLPTPLSTSYPGKVTHYGWTVVSDKNIDEWENEDEGFKIYEEAELECLKKLIEIVKDGR